MVLPERTPPSYAQRCAEFGANVILYGNSLDETITFANKTQEDSGQIILWLLLYEYLIRPVFYYYCNSQPDYKPKYCY